ncbi:MAG: hypoxanthine phosphoribosyltransferase [Clostridia bacterium]|nr:hypoxanthine phosphoribosyltransferase [Clostridia bacterium]MBQ5821146.1 hypoxanthine phosphoribosyltransferase [Clostridia bacterium]
MGYTITPYITEQEIRTRTKELAEQIKKDYEGKPILLISILKGAVVFLTDLMRALETEDVTIDFMVVSSYGHGTESNGHVKITKDLSVDIAGKDVLIVEDILDSGNTLSTIIEILRGRGVNSLRICSLLDKPSRRTTVVPLEYTGFVIPDKFVVGYGLDYSEKHRNLPYIGVVEFTEN